jgi:ADP-ribosylglycohydrolase
MDKAERVLGCVFGGAIGDAMGGPYEGSETPASVDRGAEWRIFDDTQLTLATCEALIQAEGADPETIAARMAAWFSEGWITGVGASTFAALKAISLSGHWALAGMRSERAAGNGAAIRIAPLAFFLDPADATDRRTIRDVCRITHHSDEAYAGALAILAAVHFARTGAWAGKQDLLGRVIELLPDSQVRDRLNEIERLGFTVTPAETAERSGNSGYVVQSVPLAIVGAQQVQFTGFDGMLQQLISAGADTDSIASMAGQIVGTLLGCGALPPLMIERLPEAETIRTIASRLAQTLGGKSEDSSRSPTTDH